MGEGTRQKAPSSQPPAPRTSARAMATYQPTPQRRSLPSAPAPGASRSSASGSPWAKLDSSSSNSASVTSRTIPSMQRARSSGQENAGLTANSSSSDRDRAAARRMRRHYPQQPIAQLEHHYHHQHQHYPQPPLQQHHHNSRSVADGPPRLVSSSSSRTSLSSSYSTRSSTSRVPARVDLSRSHGPGGPRTSTRTPLSRSHGANFSANPNGNMGIPAFRSNRSAKVSAGSSSGGFSPSSSGYGDSSNNHSGGVHATPYEQWRRLRRARTVSGNSSASTSSTSSFSAYVVNPNTGRPDFGLGSDEEEDDEDLEMMIDDDEEEEPREGLPSVLQHIVAPSLPPPPYPVDPYHFYCKPKPATSPASSSAADVTAALAALFAECGIEAIFHPLKCKFKCLKYVHYSHVEFVVRVYAHQRALLVEFQRRSGSVLLWDGLYRILHQKLAPIIDVNAPRCSQSSGQKRVARGSASVVASASTAPASSPPSAPDQVAISTSSQLPEPSAHEGLGAQIWRTLSLTKPTPSSGVEAMKIMLTSRYLDAQREGCAGLAELTEDVQNACLVANAELVAPLVRAAEATDLSMARCAVGALANVARAVPRFPHSELALARRTAQQLRMLGTPVVLAQLEHANERSLFSVELLRECARALGAFAKLASEVEPRAAAASSSMDERCLRVLRQHTKHRDAQLASHCREALEELRLSAI
ncbi:hypothetical protein BBJ28_00006589 [Nothophytophthora sp. Chile5]|nr:hypothetical protein BBJ28_00006589 [Nothophytophthora sp. Chile5]